MFEGFDPTEYEDEARERWGHTDAYRESARRTQAYGEPNGTRSAPNPRRSHGS